MALGGAASLLGGPPARADSFGKTPTFYLRASGGYSIYKSEMVQSNDTSTTVGYGLGVYAGREQNFGMALERESSSFAFALNQSTIAVEWQDVYLTYRWGPAWLGLVVASSGWLAKAPPDLDANGLLDQDAEGEEYLDIVTSGYGAHGGLELPVHKRTSLSMRFVYSTTGKVLQATPAEPSTAGITGTAPALGRVVSLGPRMALDLGAKVGLTRDVLSLITGFKYRTYQLTIEGQSFAELHNTTYLGFEGGWAF